MEQKIRRHFPFFIILIVYLITFSRDLYGGDSPELISAAFFLSSAHPPGYPTFLLLFRTFLFLPFNKAFLANFLNMLLGFSSLILFYKIVMKEIKSEKIAILGIFLLGFSRNFWYQSMYAETYILNLFLILLTYYLLLLSLKDKHWLFLLFFIAGLGTGNHNLYVMLFPAILYVIIFRVKPNLKEWLLCILIFLFTVVSIYAILPIRAVHKFPINWGDPINIKNFFDHISRKQYERLIVGGKFTLSDKLLFILHYFKRLFLQYNILIVLGIYGIISSFKKWRYFIDKYYIIVVNFLGLALLIPIHFSPNKAEIFSLYYLPSFVFFLMFILYVINKNKLLQKLMPIIIIFLFIFNIGKCNMAKKHIFRAYNTALLNSLPKDSVLITNGDNVTFPILYLKYVEGMREDITVYDGAGNLLYDIFYFWKFKKGEVWDRYFYVLNKCAKKYGILFVSKMLNEERYEMMNKKRFFLTDVIIENDQKSIDYNYWDSNLDNYILSLGYVNESYSSLYGQYLLRNFFHFEDIDILNNLKKIDKAFPEVYSDLSYYYFKKGNLNTAEAYLVHSYNLDRTSENIALNYANILIKTGKYQKAGAVIDKCIKLNGESFKALYSKGVLYLDKAKNEKKRYGSFDEVDIKISRENFLKAVKYNNMDYKNFTNLGQTCAILGNYEEAKGFLGISLSINPNNEIAVKSLGAIDKITNKN